MGGAQQADVNCLLLAAAHRAHRLFLYCPQQFDLHRQRQIGDLIQEQGATIGRLEQSQLVAVGTGEAALEMAEKFAFHQFVGNGAAVHRDKWLLRPRAVAVDHPGDDLLADAGFTVDMHWRLAAGEFADLAAQGDNLRRVAQQTAVPGFIPVRGCRCVIEAQGGTYQVAQTLQLYRLADEVEGAGLECRNRGLDTAVGGDHRYRDLGKLPLYIFHQADAVAVGQAHVSQAQVGLQLRDLVARLAEGCGA